jgi:hypothetical protein
MVGLETLLPLAESGRLNTYLGVEHGAQQNGSRVQLFTETEICARSKMDGIPNWELSTELSTAAKPL